MKCRTKVEMSAFPGCVHQVLSHRISRAPALVVAFDELGDGRAHVGEISKDPAVDGLLLERAIPALDDPVGFGLFNEGEAGVDAPVAELVESVGCPRRQRPKLQHSPG